MYASVGHYPEPAKFVGRKEAGGLLASLLTAYTSRPDVELMAIPRGGVPVAVEVAKLLRRPLSILVVEKIRIPVHEAWETSHAIGAVAPRGVRVLDSNRISALQISPAIVEQAVTIAQNDQIHKEELYRYASLPLRIRGGTVILVDDAVDSGATMHAAIQALRQEQPAKIVVATPVGSAIACRFLSTLADSLICPVQPAEGAAIHECYARFPPITDSEAYAMIESSRNYLLPEEPVS